MAAGSAGGVEFPVVSNRAGMSEEQLGLLWEDLKRLSACGAMLGEDAFCYVVDAMDDGVVGRVKQAKEAGRHLELTACDGNSFLADAGGIARRRLLNDASVLLGALNRMLEIYEAASYTCGTRWTARLGMPDWLEVLLVEASGFKPNQWGGGMVRCKVTAATVEGLAGLRGDRRDVLLQAGLKVDAAATRFSNVLSMVAANPAMAGQIAGHAEVVKAKLGARDVAGAAALVRLFEESGADAEPFAAEFVGLAVSPSKTLQRAAEPFLRKLGEKALPGLRERAKAGGSESRRLAIGWIWKLQGKEAEGFLRGLVEGPGGKAVRGIVEELVGREAPGVVEVEPQAELPAVECPREILFSPAVREAVLGLLRTGIEAAIRESARWRQGQAAEGPSEEQLEAMVRYLERGSRDDRKQVEAFAYWMTDAAGKVTGLPEVGLLHIVRLAKLIGHDNSYARDHHLQQLAVRYFAKHSGATLRDLAAAMKATGGSETELGRMILIENPYQGEDLLRLPAEIVWPYFAEHPELIEEAWDHKDTYSFQADVRRRAVLKALGLFPRIPERHVRLLWDLALAGNKKERPLAQAALATLPGKEERLIGVLASGRAEQRAIAAEWLGREKHTAAIPALRKALAAEKQDAAAGAMMAALEALGVPLEEFISMEGLLKEARALIAKGIPKELAWFAFDRVPKVRWAHNNRAVPREIVTWAILQSHKLGNPEPGPRLRQYTARFVREDAETLGQFVLESWIAQDTIPPTHAQADAFAQQQVTQLTQLAQSYPQFAPPGNASTWYQAAYARAMLMPVGSAIGQKGILAIAAACCGRGAAGPVERYLKTYYGNRVHQCRALLAMLSWIEDASAVQVLLSVATRFRTASIRKEAETRVNELAERKNWTRDELADRSIPTAGFEGDRSMVLDYGPREFKAVLTAELTIQLYGEDGKLLKSLPEPRQSDDAAKAAGAKKQLAASRKELASVVKLQKERLYEAMCTQRTWACADWMTFLNGHPIVGPLCQRLVWGIREGERVGVTFRPLADGSFTDAQDEAVAVPHRAVICLAHESVCGEGAGAAWRQHLSDYEVEPLFVQFGKPAVVLPEEKLRDTRIEEFKGYMTEAFKLRGRLTRAGYTRGPTGDGGWFHEYVKHFPSLGMQATIEFSGNGLPEENRGVALVSLSFSRSLEGSEGRYGQDRGEVALSEVPPVLLSECYFDYRAAAQDGPGFDAEWEKKIY